MATAPPTPPSGGEPPFRSSDIHNLSVAVDIYQKLGGLTAKVSNLEDRTNSNAEKVEQLTQWVFAIPSLERDVAQNTKDLNELGRRHDRDIRELEKVAYAIKMLGAILLSGGIGGAIFVYLYHHFIAPYLSHI